MSGGNSLFTAGEQINRSLENLNIHHSYAFGVCVTGVCRIYNMICQNLSNLVTSCQ